MEVSEYLGNDPDRKVRARNLFNTVRTVFHNNGLTLPSSSRIEIWGQDEKKKQPLTLALFLSTSEARTFENQFVQARRKGVLKIKTFRMDPQEDPAFPIPTWQNTLDTIKDNAVVRIEELKNQYNEDNEAVSKILVCEKRVQDKKCWLQY